MAKKRRKNPIGNAPLLALLGLAIGGGAVYAVTQVMDSRKKKAKKKLKPAKLTLGPIEDKDLFPNGIEVSANCTELKSVKPAILKKQMRSFLNSAFDIIKERQGLESRAEVADFLKETTESARAETFLETLELYLQHGSGTHQCFTSASLIEDLPEDQREDAVRFAGSMFMFAGFWAAKLWDEMGVGQDELLLMLTLIYELGEDAPVDPDLFSVTYMKEVGYPTTEIEETYAELEDEVQAYAETHPDDVFDAVLA